jgi:hypothetical protein
MTAEREALADRIRAALPDDRPVREVSMFGGLSFMVDDSMVVAAGRNGDCSSASTRTTRRLLDVAGAKPRSWGADRPWDRAGSPSRYDGLTTDQQLAFWIQVGMEHRAPRRRATAVEAPIATAGPCQIPTKGPTPERGECFAGLPDGPQPAALPRGILLAAGCDSPARVTQLGRISAGAERRLRVFVVRAAGAFAWSAPSSYGPASVRPRYRPRRRRVLDAADPTHSRRRCRRDRAAPCPPDRRRCHECARDSSVRRGSASVEPHVRLVDGAPPAVGSSFAARAACCSASDRDAWASRARSSASSFSFSASACARLAWASASAAFASCSGRLQPGPRLLLPQLSGLGPVDLRLTPPAEHHDQGHDDRHHDDRDDDPLQCVHSWVASSESGFDSSYGGLRPSVCPCHHNPQCRDHQEIRQVYAANEGYVRPQ